ncbi:glycosyltransferase [Patescibacteria group bacterium]|nr:glycosyltransferase [Patescibacteria group bacterium]
MKPKISIIIVHYKVKKELFDCLSSIYAFKPRVGFEVIVVDNDEKKDIEKELKEKFPKVLYLKNPGNIGFGAGNNLGAKHAKGDYLFFLNPDTIVEKGAIDKLYGFLVKDSKTGIAAPLLLDRNRVCYKLQGTRALTPITAIFSLSFISKIWRENPIYKKYYLFDWNKKEPRDAEVVPGTAFMISKNLFEKIERFDDNFFLYFEESDLCKRVRRFGYGVKIIPEARVVHLWGESTKKVQNLDKIFQKSRFYYFRKHFGLITASLVEGFLRINANTLILGLILALAAFLRFYHLPQLMMFIGDQGWFYLSARDMLLTGKIPLVGITASHTWLHQGPLWTYLLAVIFRITNFNPTAPAYFTSFAGVLSVFLLYKTGAELFSKRIGLIAAAFFASSPLIVIHSRMPYHTSLIPFFVILFILFLYRWIKGQGQLLPILAFLIGILYNLELATTVLVFVIILIYLIYRPRIRVKNLALSIPAFLIPMTPVIIYDFSHSFRQTLIFAGWIGYKAVSFFANLARNTHNSSQFGTVFNFLSEKFRLLVFPQSTFITWIFFATITALIIYIVKVKILTKDLSRNTNYLILTASFLILFLGFIASMTPSEAYLPMLFPSTIILIALVFDWLIISLSKPAQILAVAIFCLLMLLNTHYLLSKNYLLGKYGLYGPTFSERLSIAKKIVEEAHGRRYNIVGKGPGSQFASFTMNYEYLTWWLGHGSTDRPAPVKFVISEDNKKIHLREIMEK